MKLKKKQKLHLLIRSVIQILFFFLMPSAFVAGFNGIKNLAQWIGSREPLQFNSFVMVLIALCVFTMLFGRFFCGYLCAFGSANDLFSGLSWLLQKYILKRKKKFRFPRKLMRILQKLKYVNLIFLVLLFYFGVSEMIVGGRPWDVFSMLTSLRSIPGIYGTGIVFLILIFILAMLQERFFCQCLCPLGAFFSILPVLPFGKLRRNEPNCIKGCNACRLQCPADLKLEEDGVLTGECIACGKCRPVCPKGNIAYTEEKRVKQIVPVLIRAGVFFVMGCLLGLCRFL